MKDRSGQFRSALGAGASAWATLTTWATGAAWATLSARAALLRTLGQEAVDGGDFELGVGEEGFDGGLLFGVEGFAGGLEFFAGCTGVTGCLLGSAEVLGGGVEGFEAGDLFGGEAEHFVAGFFGGGAVGFHVGFVLGTAGFHFSFVLGALGFELGDLLGGEDGFYVGTDLLAEGFSGGAHGVTVEVLCAKGFHFAAGGFVDGIDRALLLGAEVERGEGIAPIRTVRALATVGAAHAGALAVVGALALGAGAHLLEAVEDAGELIGAQRGVEFGGEAPEVAGIAGEVAAGVGAGDAAGACGDVGEVAGGEAEVGGEEGDGVGVRGGGKAIDVGAGVAGGQADGEDRGECQAAGQVEDAVCTHGKIRFGAPAVFGATARGYAGVSDPIFVRRRSAVVTELLQVYPYLG